MAISIVGAMMTTAGDIAEAHADLLPMQAQVNNICYRATLRIATLPKEHPIFPNFKRANSRMVKRYPSQLHYLADFCNLKNGRLETIPIVGKTRIRTITPDVQILRDRNKAVEYHRNLEEDAMVYSDGSALEGGVGAAATLHRNGKKKTIRYKLGKESEHTVYEAELVGLYLGHHLLKNEKNLSKVTFAADNQAALVAINKRPRSGHTIVEKTVDAMERTAKKNKLLNITYSWCPGHENVRGNEEVDGHAKQAALGNASHPNEIPKDIRNGIKVNASAVKSKYKEKLLTQTMNAWKHSKYFNKMKAIDARMTGKRRGIYMKIIKGLSRRRISILTQLRTGHAPLNNHLHKIGKAENDKCQNCCNSKETVKHYLVDCPEWEDRRKALKEIDGRRSREVKHLLGDKKFIKETLKFIESTGRFKQTHGEERTNEN